MQEQTGTWTSPQGFEIFHRCWRADGSPPARAAVVLVHGLGEHSGRYGHVAQALVDLGLVVHALDHLGHGRSGGDRQRIQSFDDLSGPLAGFREWVKAQHPDLPLVMIGHSMGGLLAANDAADFPGACELVVLSAPAVKVSDNISPWTIRIGRLLSRFAPQAGVLALDPKWVSRDAQIVADYVNDPLVYHGKTPARLAAELLRTMQTLPSKLSRIAAPLLVLQGTADRLVDPAGPDLLMAHVSSDDKQSRNFEGLYHEVFNEPERDQVIGTMCDWLAQRLPVQA